MAKENSKHDHKATKKLKVILFGFVMLLPIFATMSSTLYAIFNDNAKDSYATGSQITTTTIITNSNQFIENAQVQSNYIEGQKETYTYTPWIAFENMQQDLTQYGFDLTRYTGTLLFRTRNKDNLMQLKDDTEQTNIQNVFQWGLQIKQLNYNFLYTTDIQPMDAYQGDMKFTQIYYRSATLSDTFYQSVLETFNQPIFSWARNTPFSTTVNEFTSLFGMTNTTFLNNLLSYWLSCTTIYIVIDIILECFTYLSHMLFTKLEK